MLLVDHIKSLSNVNSLSKHEQLVFGVIESINKGDLKTGDQLPSINKMVAELGYARKTIVKAYEELKERGLVESKKLKGYFIISEETKVTLKIALLLFSFQRFQEEFYNTFRKELGKRYQIDVFFHHNNIGIFNSTFTNILGKYGMYVVAPIPSIEIRPLLQMLPPDKLLVIDRYLKLDAPYSFITQEFEDNTHQKLQKLLPQIQKFKKIVLFFSDDRDYPQGIKNAYKRFLKDFDIKGEIRSEYTEGTIKKNTVYFFISDTNLWDVLRDCRIKEYVVGKDIGILSHNDHIVKQIVFGGITTISTDFHDMAKRAARHIKDGGLTQEIMPFNLIQRNSL